MAEQRPPRYRGEYHDMFWEHCNRGEFRLQCCEECGHYQWPPAPMCQECLSNNLEWTELSGRGTVYTHCRFERPYYLECPTPWPVILVELEEGPWFISNPEGIPEEEIDGGLPVAVTFIDCEDETGPFKLPVFRKATA